MTAGFQQLQYFKTLNTGEVYLAGGASGFDAQQLAQVIMVLYIHGAIAGTETLQAKLWHDSAMTKLYATSDAFTIRKIPNLATYWRGRIGLTFSSKPWIDPTANYYVSVAPSGYTRNGDSFYLALMLDWPYSINTNTNAPHYALAMDFPGYRRVAY